MLTHRTPTPLFCAKVFQTGTLGLDLGHTLWAKARFFEGGGCKVFYYFELARWAVQRDSSWLCFYFNEVGGTKVPESREFYVV
jgi:hypothetical protein